ncbi:MAG: hypothetical protein H6600_06985 [Flavobacteriales bacterium]|nr:hypothetical protein [Flavobacteriales bacterium]
MTKTCTKCKNEIPDLNLTEEARLKLYGLIYQDLKLFAVKQIMDEQKVAHREAKIIVDHLNKKYGKCGRCDYSELDKESIECPKCGAFNYNMKEPIFNQDFCSLLEFSLPFDQLEDESLRGFWCDGIDPIPHDIENLSLKKLKQNRSVRTRAWTGVSGQEIYEMTILFGEQSIYRFEQELSLEDCIYSENADDWIKVDKNNKRIEIKLK